MYAGASARAYVYAHVAIEASWHNVTITRRMGIHDTVMTLSGTFVAFPRQTYMPPFSQVYVFMHDATKTIKYMIP